MFYCSLHRNVLWAKALPFLRSYIVLQPIRSKFILNYFTEINKVQTGGALPAVQALKKPKIEKTTNGNTLSPVSENVPPSSQVPAAESPEVPVATRPPPQTHHFRRPADVFDSKLYQPTKLMEKVFIPVKEYPKVNIYFLPNVQLWNPNLSWLMKCYHLSLHCLFFCIIQCSSEVLSSKFMWKVH